MVRPASDRSDDRDRSKDRDRDEGVDALAVGVGNPHRPAACRAARRNNPQYPREPRLHPGSFCAVRGHTAKVPSGPGGGERRGVLIVAAPYPPATGPAAAAGIRARAMARGLRARGHAVTVVCAGPPQDGARRRRRPRRARPLPGCRGSRSPGRRRAARAAHRGRRRPARAHRRRARDRRTPCVPDRYVIWVPAAIAAARRAGARARRHQRRPRLGAPRRARSGRRSPVAGRLQRPVVAQSRSHQRPPARRDRPAARGARPAPRHSADHGQRSDARRARAPPRQARHCPLQRLRPRGVPGAAPPSANGPRRLLFAGTLYGKQDLAPLFGRWRRAAARAGSAPSASRQLRRPPERSRGARGRALRRGPLVHTSEPIRARSCCTAWSRPMRCCCPRSTRPTATPCP